MSNKSSLAKKFGIVSLAVFSAVGCTRQSATEVGIHTSGWGKTVEVSTEPGLKLDALLPGHKYYFMSTGEYEINVNAVLPDNIDTNQGVASSGSTSQGVIKTSEGLPLEGTAQLFLQFKNFDAENSHQVETLYRLIPPVDGENTAEYVDRIMTRLSKSALEVVQKVYDGIPVQDVTKNSEQIQKDIVSGVEAKFAEQGLDFVGVNSVILAGINLGPVAEEANQQIGLAAVQVTVAKEQKIAATDLAAAQNALHPITAGILKEFADKGANGSELDNLYCLHMKAYNEDFSKRHPQGCFGTSDLERTMGL